MKTLVKIGTVYVATGAAIVVVAIMQDAFCTKDGKHEVIQFFSENTDCAIMAAIRTSFVAPILLVKRIVKTIKLLKEED
jgi:hypothetical protein